MYNPIMQKLGSARSVIRETFEYGLMRKREIGEENVFDFSIGNPSVPAPACVENAMNDLLKTTPRETLFGYTSAPGALEVREAVANYIKRQFGVEMPASLVYMTCGAAASLSIVFHALFEEGDEFIVVAPFFPEYRVFIERAGGKVVVVNSDETFHLDVNAIENAITAHTKAVVINSPNNPSGAVYGKEEIKALSEALGKAGKKRGKPIMLISDEPYRELVYGAEVPYVMNFYDNSIVCYSFSKSLSLAGERIGYIAVSPKCVQAETLFSAVAGAGRALGYVCAPALFQRVAARCLGEASDIGVYKKNRDLLYGALTEDGFSCIYPEGAFYLFLKTPEDAAAFCRKAREYELLFVPSDSFGTAGYVRISYCVSEKTIKGSLPAFRALAKEYKLC